jgi:hypothetical protein
MMRMMGHPDAAVDRPAAAFDTPIAYAGLVYGKGPYLYNALREAAGDTAFFAALRRYVTTWRFRLAPPTGFVDALSAAAPRQAPRFRALAQRWLHEAHGDEDLGQGDLGSMMSGMLGQGADRGELQDALRVLAPLLGGQGTGAPANGARGGTPSGGGAPAQDPSQMLQQAIEALGGM